MIIKKKIVHKSSVKNATKGTNNKPKPKILSPKKIVNKKSVTRYDVKNALLSFEKKHFENLNLMIKLLSQITKDLTDILKNIKNK